MMTAYDKLKSIPNSEKYLKGGITFEIIDKVAFAMTDNRSADRFSKPVSHSLKPSMNEK
jgi:hypothetical protein